MMRWKEFILMPAVVVAVGLTWITWEARRAKSEQEAMFQVPVSDDPQVYVDYMRQLNNELMYIRSQESWHFKRVYESMDIAAKRLRKLIPAGEPLPRYAALCDVSYRAARSYTFDALDTDEVQTVLNDFELYMSRDDAIPIHKHERMALNQTLQFMLSLLENHENDKEESLAYAARLGAKIDGFDDLVFRESARSTLLGFRNRISLLQEPYRLSGETLDGDEWDSAEHQGKVVYIEFWSTTCKPCVAELSALRSINEAHGDQLAIVGVSRDRSKRTLDQFAEDLKISWPQLWIDSEVGNLELFESLGIEAVPYSIVLDRTGRVIALNVRADELEESLGGWLQSE